MFVFGSFSLDPGRRQLLCRGEPVAIGERAFDVLLTLVDEPGKLLTKTTIINAVWADQAIVEDNLVQAVCEIRRVLGDDAHQPRYVKTVSGRGYRFIAEVAQVRDEPAPLIAGPFADEGSIRDVMRGWRRRWIWPAIGIAALLIVVGAVMTMGPERDGTSDRTAPLSATRDIRPAIATLGFHSLGADGDYAWISSALREMLSTELVVGGKLRLVSGENVARIRHAHQLPETGSLAVDTLASLHEVLGADYAILGTYLVEAESGALRIDVNVQEFRTGKTISSLVQTGQVTEFLDLVAGLGDQLREEVFVYPLTDYERRGLLAARPRTTAAARYYADGLEKLRVNDTLAARELFELALESDPGFILCRSALAQAWEGLGYQSRAEEQASLAFELADRLPSQQAAVVEARYRVISGEHERAVEIYRSLIDRFPDDLELGLALAETQVAAGRGRDALSTIELLRTLPDPQAGDPRIDLVEASAAMAVSDFVRQKQAAVRAATRSRELGARYSMAAALQQQGVALRNLGHPEQALRAFEEAREVCEEGGITIAVAVCMVSTASLFTDQGRFAEAEDMLKRAMSIYDRLGNIGQLLVATGNLGRVYQRQGRYRRAEEQFKRALVMAEEIDDRHAQGRLFNNLASIRYADDDLDGVVLNLDKALVITREMHDAKGAAMTLANIARTLCAKDELDAARERGHQALDLAREIGSVAVSAHVLEILGDIDVKAGLFDDALERFDEAAALFARIDAPFERSQTLWRMVDALHRQGRFIEARERAAAALVECRECGARSSELKILVLLAEILLDMDEPAAASTLIAEAKVLAEQTGKTDTVDRLNALSARLDDCSPPSSRVDS